MADGFFKNQKYVFLQALILTIIVLNIGVYMGYKLESSRIDKINQLYLQAEIDLTDQRIQGEALDIIDIDCNKSIQSNINFADKIFNEAKKIKQLEDSNKFNNDIILSHQRFDLLRVLFWINSIKIKEKCNADYHNLVYFYNFQNPTIEEKAEQAVFSNFLTQLKEKYGNKVMLVPLAVDGNLPSINLLVDHYDIKKLPVVLIDEKVKIEDVNKLDEIESYLK